MVPKWRAGEITAISQYNPAEEGNVGQDGDGEGEEGEQAEGEGEDEEMQQEGAGDAAPGDGATGELTFHTTTILN